MTESIPEGEDSPEEKARANLLASIARSLGWPLFNRLGVNNQNLGVGEIVTAGEGNGFGGLPKGTKVHVRPDGGFTVLWTPQSMAQFQAESLLSSAKVFPPGSRFAIMKGIDHESLKEWDVERLTSQCLKVLERADSSPEAFLEYKRKIQEEGAAFWLQPVEAKTPPGPSASNGSAQRGSQQTAVKRPMKFGL
jgi:hypothetical protein